MCGRHNLRRGSVAIARPAVTFSRGPGGAAADIDLFFCDSLLVTLNNGRRRWSVNGEVCLELFAIS